MKGEIIKKDALLLRHAVGEAKGENGIKYEMCNSTNMSPLIKSSKTGETFSLSWPDIISLAVEAGIDEN